MGGAIELPELLARAPMANAAAERMVRTLRQECLDQNGQPECGHLQTILGEFPAYYNLDRPHRSLVR